jgi:hypothetical protein
MEERTDFEAFAADMQKKATVLLEEVEQFNAHLKDVKKNVSLGGTCVPKLHQFQRRR